jgi:DNA anti-recombination protein RmuC
MTLGETSALDLAARRLERAVAQLEQKLAARPPAAVASATASAASSSDLFDGEATRLKAQLDAARDRERALEEAGAQASVALGRAIAEIRAALGDEATTANDDGPHSDYDDEPETDELFDEPGKA